MNEFFLIQKEYLEKIEEETEKYGLKKMIIGGDFNARTARQGRLSWDVSEEEEEETQKEESQMTR